MICAEAHDVGRNFLAKNLSASQPASNRCQLLSSVTLEYLAGHRPAEVAEARDAPQSPFRIVIAGPRTWSTCTSAQLQDDLCSFCHTTFKRR